MISILILTFATCLRRAASGRRAVPTHYRVAVIGICLLGSCAEICMFGIWGIRSAQLHYRSLTQQTSPAVALLLQIDRDLYQAQVGVERTISAPDATGRDAAADVFRQNVAESEQRFGQYRTIALWGPLERSEAQAYESDRTAWIEAAESLVERANPAAKGNSALPAPDSLPPVSTPKMDAPLQVVIDRFETMRSHVDRIITDVYQPAIAQAADASERNAWNSFLRLLIGAGVGIGAGAALTVNLTRVSRAQHVAGEAMNAERERQNSRQTFDAQLGRGLDMAQDENATLRLVEQAIAQAAPDIAAEILLADSSRAHLEQSAAVGRAAEKRCCNVGTPNDCPAVRKGHRLSFESGTLMDACPHLKGRPEGNISATCIPLSIMGQSVGVLHAASPDRQLPDEDRVRLLERIASRASERIGLLRAFRQTTAQASCDPLTGLMNRRSLEEKVHLLTRQGATFAVAYGDLDHFKTLNDTHGHETGDKALRTFAHQLKSSVRPSDLPARWGGEEFVLVLPHSNAEAAVAAIDRVRAALAKQLQTAGMPRFTVSFGVAEIAQGELFVDALARADAALLNAKRAGRNRTIISDAAGIVSPGSARPFTDIETAEPAAAA